MGRPVIQGFVGSMDYIRARKGVILTTSSFTKDAVDFVERTEGKKVVLINCDQLADLMIEKELGVTTTKTYEIGRCRTTSSMRAASTRCQIICEQAGFLGSFTSSLAPFRGDHKSETVDRWLFCLFAAPPCIPAWAW